jgi:hypothetical protein
MRFSARVPTNKWAFFFPRFQSFSIAVPPAEAEANYWRQQHSPAAARIDHAAPASVQAAGR